MATVERRRLLVNGIVQGVGFRPFVYNLALSEDLTGRVTNTSVGVVIEVQGPVDVLDRFADRLTAEAPPLSQIVSVESGALDVEDEDTFLIRKSTNAPGTDTLIPPDVATCADCLAEITDPADRRFGYPFTNCTNCGPRWTIIGRIPYDRPFTSMARFTMCPLCQAEYDDPTDRRFHAQPNACPKCGPRVWLCEADGEEFASGVPAINEAADALADGMLLAAKGLGGFHLAVRADDATAVARLRERKSREAKPLAVMVRDLDAARDLCRVSDDEAVLLSSPRAPIVLLEKRTETAPGVADGHRRLGVMLPYTPLHHLLLAALAERGVHAVVMTSGNASDEPICLGNDEALKRLAHIADRWLLHNRDILRRADDSVVQLLDGQPHLFRRSRGYAPVPVILPDADHATGPILAVGPEMKNTVCLLKGDRAFLSPHIGDLETLQANAFFNETIDTLKDVLECEPELLALDMHPGYFSGQWARAQILLEQEPVQHHHAHMAAVLAEHGVTGRAVGLIMDGTGYGLDETIWGGEVLVGDLAGFTRWGHLAPVPLPGGDAAVKAPWRTALSYLRHTYGAGDLPDLPVFDGKPAAEVLEMIDKGINSPLTSSCGRLFDAVAALTGRWDTAHYEAQAAIELMALTNSEKVALATPLGRGGPHLTPVAKATKNDFEASTPRLLSVAPIIRGVVEAVQAGVPVADISARFHRTLIDLLVEAAVAAAREAGLSQIVLSGGSFQNEILMSGVCSALEAAGLDPLRPLETPCNDGQISLGQAVVARARLNTE